MYYDSLNRDITGTTVITYKGRHLKLLLLHSHIHAPEQSNYAKPYSAASFMCHEMCHGQLWCRAAATGVMNLTAAAVIGFAQWDC